MVDRDELERACLARRELLLRGPVDERDQEMISSGLLYLNHQSEAPISLFINSKGGDTLCEGYIMDAIASSAAPIHGVVRGMAYSAAFCILQACHLRKAFAHARLMFHGMMLSNLRIDRDDFDEIVARTKKNHEE